MLVDLGITAMRKKRSKPMTGIEKAIEHAGTQAKLAALLGTDQQLVSYWKRKGIVSDAGMCAAIERVTNIRCEELNPGEDWTTLRLVLCAPDRDNIESSDDTQPPAGVSSGAKKTAKRMT